MVSRTSVRVPDGRRVSALVWGDGPAESVELVFVHGGSQNAHTWDTTIMAMGCPAALAVDLPGHGHSDWRDDGDYGPKLNAAAVEPRSWRYHPGFDPEPNPEGATPWTGDSRTACRAS